MLLLKKHAGNAPKGMTSVFLDEVRRPSERLRADRVPPSWFGTISSIARSTRCRQLKVKQNVSRETSKKRTLIPKVENQSPFLRLKAGCYKSRN